MSQSITNILLIAEVVVVILLSVSILLQNRAEGLGKMFGGGGEVFRTRRGLENFLYYATIILIVVMAALSFILVKFGA
ncbi:MAG TPA: preprotein translocase subunit SecG [Candidatus Dojkabacteria bacterium]|nr:preprotein translocase subunit SecG [Candidatus Dojkabacteria bacterium]HQG58108.1 preprotein translocase subunit SecG [Candidatus Dojkabacteria bacterium]